MNFSRRIAEQLAQPDGFAGQLIGSLMDAANRKPTRLAVDLLTPRPAEHVLDAGCGTGAAIAELLRRAPCRVTGVDPSRTMLRSAQAMLQRKRMRGNAEVHRCRIEDMPFADGSFDAALLLNVLYFCDAEGRMLTQLARALKRGGRLVAYVTHMDSMRNWPFATQGIHRLFDSGTLRDLFLTAGFAPERIAVHEIPVTRSILGLFVHATT